MKSNLKLIYGLLIGVFSPILFIPVLLAIIAEVQYFEFTYLWDQFLNLHIIRSKYLSLCLLSNLAWFYFFLNKQNYQIARGIIGGTLFYIPYILYVNYIY